MKEPRLTLKNIERALSFLERRITHAKTIKNKDWQREFENVTHVIKELTAYGK
jgi:hypothetical protein